MARRRSKSGRFVKTSSAPKVRVVSVPSSRPSTSIIKVSAPRMSAPKRGGRIRRAAHRVGAIASNKPRMSIIIGAVALGYAHKEKWLEKLPLIGKAGPVTSAALLGWGLEEFAKVKLPPLVRDMVTAGLAISAFNIGFSGGNTVVGDGTSYSMPGGAVFFD